MILPAKDYQSLQTLRPAKLHQGFDRLANNLLGRSKRRDSLKQQWLELAKSIHQAAEKHQTLSDQQLQAALNQQRQLFRRRKQDDETLLPDALALLVEAADRTLGMRPFPVQVLGAIMIYHGYIAEMATGEGKSLTACLPAVLFAWSDRPCHIITTNDYLALRDAKQMSVFYRFCRLTTGCVGSDMTNAERQENYQKGVVYTTSKELLADFLRDRLQLGNCAQSDRRLLKKKLKSNKHSETEIVMRGINAVIVDEADSVLIDEAVTPLIISQTQQNKPLSEAITLASQFAQQLKNDLDYRVNKRHREVTLTESGEKTVAELTIDLPGLWQSDSRRNELIVTALTAKELYQKDQQYVIDDDKVVIVDEFTGRMMPQRTWRQGLHQSVEVQEGLELSDPSETQARLSFQRFFRLFHKLGGMSGTVQESAEELWHIYNLPILAVPTNRPCARKQLPNRYHWDKQSKWQTICAEVIACQQNGQPVLIGTRSIADSQLLAEMLREQGISLQLLNAINHHEETEIITSAGQLGKVTIATNMAGRGADIKLGKGVAKLGGLHVIVSERHESQRIDRQLIGRCARQGQPGSYRLYSSLEDDILQRFGNKPLLTILRNKLSANGVENQKMFEKALRLAQQSAEKQAFDQRAMVTKTDDWLTDALSFVRTETLPD